MPTSNRREQSTLDTLDLTRDCHTANLEANDSTRRPFTQAFFAKTDIEEDDETREPTVRVDYNEPFDTLLSRLIPASVHGTLDINRTVYGRSRWAIQTTYYEVRPRCRILIRILWWR